MSDGDVCVVFLNAVGNPYQGEEIRREYDSGMCHCVRICEVNNKNNSMHLYVKHIENMNDNTNHTK